MSYEKERFGAREQLTSGAFRHEFSGTVTKVGDGVSKLRAGDKVAVQPSIYCGQCGACKVHAENACPKGGFVGLSGGGGGMSEFVVVPQEACFPLPSNVDLDIGALVEPLSVAWHAVAATPVEPNCLVIGGGPIGLVR